MYIIASMEIGRKVETLHTCRMKVTKVDNKQNPLLSVPMCWEILHVLF